MSLKEQLGKKEDTLDYYKQQLQRRETNSEQFKEWRDDWFSALTEHMDLLTNDHARLQSENSLLLSRVQACKDLEAKLRELSDENLDVDGCYLSTQDAEVLQ